VSEPSWKLRYSACRLRNAYNKIPMLTMYCKLFSSLYQGTLRGRPDEILVFTNLLAHADAFGIVDKHFRAISEEVGITIERVKAAIDVLESPDPESRSPEEGGARLVKLDGHRIWGWKIVNYGKYRAIKNEDDRREQNRLAQERWRNKNKPSSSKVSSVSLGKPPSAQAEGEAEAYERGNASLPKAFNCGEVLDEWNKNADNVRLPRCLQLSDKRRRYVEARLRDPFFSENWRAALGKISESTFCKGTNDRGWKATFDWFIRPDSVAKTMEGQYDNRAETHQQRPNPRLEGVSRNNAVNDYAAAAKRKLERQVAASANGSPPQAEGA